MASLRGLRGSPARTRRKICRLGDWDRTGRTGFKEFRWWRLNHVIDSHVTRELLFRTTSTGFSTESVRIMGWVNTLSSSWVIPMFDNVSFRVEPQSSCLLTRKGPSGSVGKTTAPRLQPPMAMARWGGEHINVKGEIIRRILFVFWLVLLRTTQLL